MTGWLLVRCGSCGATNKVRSLREMPSCVECTLAISKVETVQCGMLLGLLSDVDRRLLGVALNKVSGDQGVNDLPHVLGGQGVEVP